MSLILSDLIQSGIVKTLLVFLACFVLVYLFLQFADTVEEIEQQEKDDLEKELEKELNQLLAAETDHY